MNVRNPPIADIPRISQPCLVNLQLETAEGDPTRLGDALRLACLLIAIASGLALLPVGFIGLLSSMICGGGCTNWAWFAVTSMTLSPLLLMVSMMAGVPAFRGPSWRLILLTLVPASLAALGFLIAP